MLLVDLAAQPLIDDQEAHNFLNLGKGYLQLLRNERQCEPGVWCDELDDSLGTHVPRYFVYVLGDERILQQVLVVLQDLLVFVNVLALIGVDKVGHGGDAGVVLVGLRFLGIEGIDVGTR
jgi:hypothetical protein